MMNKNIKIEMKKIFGDCIPKSWGDKELAFLKKAYDFAYMAHKGGVRRGTDLPYIVHPIEAACIAMTMSEKVEVIAAALLHDVVEDTKYSLEDIREHFGETVEELVAEETENKREDVPSEESWKIRKEEAIERFLTASYEAKIVALSDKLANIRSIERDYTALGEVFWQRFHQKDKNEHSWYYRSMAHATHELSDTDAWKEYERLCEKVFGQ